MSRSLRWKLAWIRLAAATTRVVLATANKVLFRQDSSKRTFRRILVYRIGNIGDILVTLPAQDAIRARFPDAHIALFTSPGKRGAPGAAQILPLGKWFDELLVYYTPDVRSWKGRWSLLRRLREGEFDLFVELPNQPSRLRDELRNMMLARLAGCRWAVGFAISQQTLFLREQALHIPQERESVRIYCAVAGKLGLDAYRDPRLPVSNICRKEIAELLRGFGILENERFIVVHAGAKRHTNQWPLERFASIADEIVHRWGTRVVLTGGPSELPLVEQLVSMMRARPSVLCGEIDLPRMAALLERASLYVGNDTGPMHLAAAVGTPVVGIFGARDFPERWYPAGAGHSVLRRDVPCSPCFKEVCDQNLICLKRVETELVVAAVERQLNNQEFSAAAHTRA
jgi:heptosyltransferase-3